MKTTPRVVVFGLVLMLALSACTSSAEPVVSGSPSPTVAKCEGVNLGAADATGEGALPAVVVECLQGSDPVRLSTLRGPLLIAVWASWCQPCKKELPVLDAFARDYQGQVAVLGYNLMDVTDQAIAASVNWGVSLASVEDQEGVYRAELGISAPPTTLFVDISGRVIYRHFGAIKDRAELVELVESKFGIDLK